MSVIEEPADGRALLTTEELAVLLRKPVRTVGNWRTKQMGPPYLKVGGHDVRYRWSDVAAWLETQVRVP